MSKTNVYTRGFTTLWTGFRRLLSTRWGKWSLVGLVVIVALSWMWARSSGVSSARGQTPYKTVTVKRGSIEVVASADGYLQAVDRRELRASIGGRVIRVLVKQGDTVQPGQVLVELDSDDVKAKLEKAEVALELAQRELNTLIRNRRDLTIRAPVSGRVVFLQAADGKRLTAGATVAKIVDDRYLEVIGYFTQAQIGAISVGQEADVFLPDYISAVHGTVTRVSRTPQAGSSGGVLFPVTIRIENPGALRAGMAAEVQVRTRDGDIRAVTASSLQDPAGYEVVAKVGGVVSRVPVREGDRVSAGDVLAELSGEDLEDQISVQQLKVRQAQLDVDSARADLANKTIVAPCAGTVADVPIKEGEYVSQGGVVVVLADPGRLQAVVEVDEVDVVKVKVGQEAVITADALPGEEFQGEVSEVAVEGRQKNGVGVYDVTVVLKNPGKLRHGMSCHVKIKVASKSDALLVPVEALQLEDGGYRVWVASGSQGSAGSSNFRSGSDTRSLEGAKLVRVKVGLVSSTMAEIVEGLKEGDIVLVPSKSSSASEQRVPGPFGPVPFGGGAPSRSSRQGVGR